ncbi:RDD family protein [Streptomyces sp. NPDC001941]|uniref:RDD family protein n=1 Tax=Streptomyces sp. NPDC001941 TaxID=3154659 RepID=UPI003321C292
MSAPTPATGDGSPTPGYYPDPSIPGYVRYWNGAAWVPGTSRPAPRDGEALPAAPASAAPPAPVPAVEETGPVFLDEDPPEETHQEPASAWAADVSRQTGFGGERDHRVSWGAPEGRDPRAADPRGAADPTGGALPGVRRPELGPAHAVAPVAPVPAAPVPAAQPALGPAAEPRALPPAEPAPRAPRGGAPAAEGTMSIRALPQQPQAPQPGPAHQAPQPAPVHQGPQSAPARPGTVQPQPARPAPQAQQPVPPVRQAQAPATQAPRPSAPVTPLTAGPGGGAASWAQQARPEPSGGASGGAGQQPVVPWKPPVADPFLAAAQAQANARPAALGKRLAARLVDTVVLGALAGAAAYPFVTRALDHIDGKIEAAKQSGETVTVWLLDGTSSAWFGAALGVLLVLGVLYEAVPTAKWGRTLGKKLFGLQVRDIEAHEPPSFGAALRRWLVYGLLGVLAVGLLNVLWCVFDRPWRQCWHDKAARTFVAG